MASTINASSSGSGGLISTGDASGVLQLQNNGTVAVQFSSGNTFLNCTSSPISSYGTGRLNIDSGQGIYVAGYGDGLGFGQIFKQSASASGNNGWPLTFVNSSETSVGGVRQRSAYVEYQTTSSGSTGAVLLNSGVQFPATQVTSADANTLDDYEEGTWTPGFSFGGGTTGIIYSAQYGTYTKIGNTVRVTAYVQMSNKGSSTGQMRVTGLPFTCNSNARGYSVQTAWLNNTVSALNGAIGCYVEPNSTTIYYEKMSGGFYGAFQQINDTMVGNSTDTMINVTYQVA